MLLQIPGGPELIVIFLITILIFGIPLLLVVVVGAIYLRAESGGSDDDVAERVENLEAEMSEVREQVGDGSASSDRAERSGQSTDRSE